jgi:hypothetical protein
MFDRVVTVEIAKRDRYGGSVGTVLVAGAPPGISDMATSASKLNPNTEKTKHGSYLTCHLIFLTNRV